jgi:protocatechuate 3,4-dioxygenase beta subunit
MTFGKWTLSLIAGLAIALVAGGVGLRLYGTSPARVDAAPTASSEPQQTEEADVQPAKVAEANGGPIAVSGKVVGPDGKPVPQARLFVFDSEEWTAAPQKQAGPDGAFSFELPPLAGRRSYRYLVATAPDVGLGCDWIGVAAAGPAPLRDAVLRLPKDVPVRGRLVDLEGKPIAGARVRVTDLFTGKDDTLNEFVRLWSKEKDRQEQAFRALHGKRLYAAKATAGHFTAVTDADGRFTLPGIGRDRCPLLTVSARGKGSQVCIVVVRPDFQPAGGNATGSPVLGPEFTLPLTPAVPVSGVVRDAAKKPLAGVRVRGQVDLSDSDLNGWLVLPDLETVTDAEGRYVLDGLPKAKKYVFLADPKPGEPSTHHFVVHDDGAPGIAPVTVDFDLPRGVVLTGRITDMKTGKPVRGCVFYRPLWSNKWVEEHPGYDSPGLGPWYADAQNWTDADGRFTLTVVPGPGILHAQVLGHDTERDYALARLAPEDDTDEIVHKQFGEFKTFKTSGQGGGFGPMNLNAYRVLRIPADARTFNSDVTVDPGVDRVVKIVGPDGQPVSGAWVLNERSLGGFSEPLRGSEFTAFALDPEHPRRIYAQHDGKKLAGFVALDGKEAGPVVLQLEATATLTGRVVDGEGKPLAGYRVEPDYDDAEIGILLNTRRMYGTTPVVTAADGTFRLEHIPAGLSVRLHATKKSGESLGHTTPKRTLKAGQTLDLGDWKPK